ncbi:uncharacterized protein LOC119444700 [Dermacentor silvarum]|uniref:uncharacterized protein LOC119444700 n=1 Tax=Dermacentor silvarum TaxID=543639 RepID=UPI0021007D1E|nr:uncharacterized protein LOC119444700 [Dermacentor silvarum]
MANEKPCNESTQSSGERTEKYTVTSLEIARLGKLDEYDEKEQNFESYLERFEHFVTANNIKEEKKLAVFLSVIGPRTYEVLKSLVVPAVPGDKSFEEVTVLLTKHYSPSCSVFAERCKFNRRAQEEQESIEVFIVSLKHLARKCDFGLFLQDALRDRLVAGIRREETQLALFAEDSLTFEKACKIALDREQAARQTALLHAEGKEATLHAMAIRVQGTEKKLKLRKFKDVKRVCERCGKAHAASVCWYKNVQCHSCSQIGHLQKMCPSKCRELKTANAVDCCDSDSELDVYHVINTVRSGYEVQVNVEGKDICMQIDTRAAVTLIPESVRLNAFPHVKCEPSRVTLRTYTGEPVPVKGQCNVIVTTGNQALRLPVIIVKDHGKQLPLLMGRNWLEMLGLDWKSVLSVNVSDASKVEAVKQKFPGVFSKQPGVVKNYQRDERPVAFASRTLTSAEKNYAQEPATQARVPQAFRQYKLLLQPRKTQLIRLLRCLVGQSPCHLSGFQARKSLQISSFRYLNHPRPEQLPPALRTSQTLHLQPSCQFFVVVPVCDIPRTDSNQ